LDAVRGSRQAILVAEWAAFAAVLFLSRFVARGHLVPRYDEECTLGAVAVDVLAHGVRFPLSTYAPNEYDNGFFLSGLLTAASFSLLDRNVLALKLVTLAMSALGAVAALSLLRGCLAELGLTSRRARWTATAALVIAIALAPRVVTLFSTCAVGIGSHAEGTALETVLLAVFARRLHLGSSARTMVLWALIGLALHVDKGMVLVLPVLGGAELVLARRTPGRLAAALGGLIVGGLPELFAVARRQGMGWMELIAKLRNNAQAFPEAFLAAVGSLADDRLALLGAWALSLAAAMIVLLRIARRRRWREPTGAAATDAAPVPLTLAVVLGVACVSLSALTMMAQGPYDYYTLHTYPTLVVLYALLVGWICGRAVTRWGERSGTWVGVAALGVTVMLYFPATLTWGAPTVSALWRDRAGAACSWRLAQGFLLEPQRGLASGDGTPEQHAIARCRSLSEHAQVIDCIGGIARALRFSVGTVGEPPAELSADERLAFAFYHGVRRRGDATPCAEFTSADLRAACIAAVQLDCLANADISTRFASGRAIGRPRCAIPPPPMEGYWDAVRADLLARPGDTVPNLALTLGDTLARCQPILDACY